MRDFGGIVGERDYRSMVGDGTGTSIVEATLNWICRQFPEAPPALWKVSDDDTRDRLDQDAAIQLLRRPNYDPRIRRSWYSFTHLIMATLVDWNVDGNAYWLKVRNRFGVVIQLWYCPHWLIRPASPFDGTDYISAYEYRPRGKLYELDPRDVVHFRFGIDRDDPRLGWSQLKGQLRHVATDEERARFAFSILKNLGFPGVIIAPADKDAPELSDEEAEATKKLYMAKFTGDRRGEPLIMKGATTVTPFGFSPQQMDLSAISNIAEERITSALGVPAAVVGMGAGLEEAHTNATMKELRAAAWEAKLIPDGRLIASDIFDQVVAEFHEDLDNLEFGFDLRKVRALQEDEVKLAQKHEILVRARIERVDEARSALDLDVSPEDRIFLEPISVTPVGPGAPKEPEPPALPPGAPPTPALPAGADAETGKQFAQALRDLRMWAAGLEADGKRDDQVAAVIKAMESARASSDRAMLEGLTQLAKAIAERPISVAVVEAAKTGELRTVKERDDKGQITVVEVRPLEPAAKNGGHA